MHAHSRYHPARVLALVAPLLLLGGALFSQYVGGLSPCEMCMWQRWPHEAAIFFAILSFLFMRTPGGHIMIGLAAVAIAISGLIGVYHAGVEYYWWEGVTICSAPAGGGSDVLGDILSAPLIRCDVPQWTLAGISLAGFNAILSLGSAIAIFVLLVRAHRATPHPIV